VSLGVGRLVPHVDLLLDHSRRQIAGTAQQIATRCQSNTRASPGSSASLASLVTLITSL
jgi:hypothetical protein